MMEDQLLAIVSIYVDKNFTLVTEVGVIIPILLFVIVILLLLKNGFPYSLSKLKNMFDGEVTINIPFGTGSIKIKPNNETKQISYKAWVELVTRKAGIPIDSNHDLISEIYDSWYVLFSTTRELIKEIPASKLSDGETQKLITLLVETLNNGLRPHLTKWQAKYRKWYEKELADNKNRKLSPQEIQKKFPDYVELMNDLKRVNTELIKYREQLEKLSA